MHSETYAWTFVALKEQLLKSKNNLLMLVLILVQIFCVAQVVVNSLAFVFLALYLCFLGRKS